MTWLEPYHEGVLTSQLDLQEDQAFTDLTVRLRDGEVRTCRLTLASLSRVFHRMLTTDMKERNEGVVTLECVSRKVWHCILSFYLSGDKLVTADNVEDVLIIAHLYQLEALMEHCERVLVDTLTSENCCHRLELSKKLLLSASRIIFDFIKKNFVTLSQNLQILCLSKECMLELLNSPIVITTEDFLCDTILKWITANDVDDDTSLEMLNSVKLQDLSNEYVCKTLMYHGQVIRNSRIQDSIAEEMMRRNERYLRNLPSIPRQRSPKGTPQNIMVFGYDKHRLRTYYSTGEHDAWLELPSPMTELSFAAHMVGDTIFVTGGLLEQQFTHTFLVPSKTWSRGPDLQQGRCLHGMTSLGDSVFVVAGYGSNRSLTCIEKLDTGSDSWQKIGDLLVSTHCSGVATVGDVIIVVGGLGTPDIIQTFNVKTKTAFIQNTPLPAHMRNARGASLTSGAVFLGERGDLVHVSLSDSSVTVTSHVLLSGFGKRAYFGLAVEGGHLLCCGGEMGRKTRIHRFSLQGEQVDTDSLPELPAALSVYATFVACI